MSAVYFVKFMSDLFHQQVGFEFIDGVMDIIRQLPRHTYQILTEQIETIIKYFKKYRPPRTHGQKCSSRTSNTMSRALAFCEAFWARVRFLSAGSLPEDLSKIDLWDIHYVISGGKLGVKSMQPSPNLMWEFLDAWYNEEMTLMESRTFSPIHGKIQKTNGEKSKHQCHGIALSER